MICLEQSTEIPTHLRLARHQSITLSYVENMPSSPTPMSSHLSRLSWRPPPRKQTLFSLLKVKFLLHNRRAELRLVTNRVGGGVVLSVDKVRAPAPAATASDALEEEGGGGGVAAAAAAAVPDADNDEHEATPPRRSPQGLAPEGQSKRMASVVVVRGTAPRVSAAGAMLLERLKVRDGGGRG